MTTLTVTCPDCDGEGNRYTSRYGGNDPNTWFAGPCDCDHGLVALRCVECDQAEAIEWFQGDPLCGKCVAAAKECALWVGEDVG